MKNSKIVFIFLCLCLTIIVFFLNDRTGNFEEEFLIDRFDGLDSSLNNGFGCSDYGNDDGTYSWAEGYLLESYLTMYEATGNERYLDKFVFQANKVIEMSDKSQGKIDYRNRSLLGWSATKYSNNNESVIIPVTTAMIIYPFLKFSLLVREGGLEKYFSEAGYFLEVSEEAMRIFDDDWRYDVLSKKGTYELTDAVMGGGWGYTLKMKKENPEWIRYYPFNSDAALGRVLILLWRLTGEEEYYFKAEAIARHFKSELIEQDGGYVWHYYPKQGMVFNPSMEDISHGAIDVSFAFDAYKAEIVFSEKDLLKFSNTLINMKKENEFSRFVNGSGQDFKVEDKKCGQVFERKVSDSSGRWLDLSEVDCGIYPIVRPYLLKRTKRGDFKDPQVLLGLSKLIKYADKCEDGKTQCPDC